MLKNYLKMARRNIARHQAYSCINILGLSLGLCFCLVINTITSFELGFDSYHFDKDLIYRLVSKTTEST
jgi:putative ABC transport system permease protein